MATVSRYSDKTHKLGNASAEELKRSASLLTGERSPQGMRGNIPFSAANMDGSSRAQLGATQIPLELDGKPMCELEGNYPSAFEPSVEPEDDLYSY